VLKLEDYGISFCRDVEYFKIENVSVSIRASSCLLILGKNGTGKTTLLKSISRSHPSQQGVLERGKITLNNKPIKHSQCTYLPIETDIIPNLTIYEHFCLGLKHQPFAFNFILATSHQNSDHVTPYYEKYFSSIFRSDQLGQFCNNLSSGEKKLLLIGAILLRPNQVVLLDEPTAHLDDLNKIKITDLLHDIWREKQFTLIISTHDPILISKFRDETQIELSKSGKVSCLSSQAAHDRNIIDDDSNSTGLARKKIIYHDFVKYAAKHWAFGEDVNNIEIDFLGINLEGTKVLVAGSGVGRESKYIVNKGANVVCIDNSVYMLDECRKNLMGQGTLLLQNMCKIGDNFLSETFDMVVCLGNTISALLSLEERRFFLNAVYTVLKDSGTFVIDYTPAINENIVFYQNNYDAKIDLSNKNDAGSHGMFVNYKLNGKILTCYQYYLTPSDFNMLIAESGFVKTNETAYVNGHLRNILSLKKVQK
jgi:iron complex transport system ATP-binding protein